MGSSRTRTLTPRTCSTASVARVRSPGDSDSGGRSTCSADSPNLASADRAAARSSTPVAAWKPASRVRRAGEQVAALADLADHDARPDPLAARREGQPAEQRRQQRRLARAVAADDGHPVAPRRPPATPARAGSRASPSTPGRSTTASASRATTSPPRPASAMVRRRSQPSHGLSTVVEPGEGLVGDLRLGRHVLGALHVAVADELVGLARALRPPQALVGPLALGAGPLGERRRACRRRPGRPARRAGGPAPARRGRPRQPPS